MASAGGNMNSYLDLKRKNGKKSRPTFGFDLKTPKTDLVLVCNEKKMYVTRLVLEMVSPVFQKMFGETLDESQGNEIKIEGKDYYDFAEFLACIYPGIKLKVTIENVYRLQSLAFEYEVEYLKADCRSVLADSLKDKNDEANLFKCMGVAYNYNIKALKIKCLKQAVEVYKEDISRADELMQMRSSYRDDIWKSVYPVMRSDASKFRFVTAAAKHVNGYRTCFESFNDAKYVATNWKFDLYEMRNNGKESLDLPPVWDGYRIRIDAYRGSKDFLQFVLHANHDLGNAQCLASLIIEFINIIPWNKNKNVFIGNSSEEACGIITANPSVFFIVGPENFQPQEKGFILDGLVEVRIHLLVNRPSFE